MMENRIYPVKIMPVITLYQPWATWIMNGWKTIETRTHDRFKSLNGKTILIHAGMKTDNSDLAVNNKFLLPFQRAVNPIINGAILGMVHVSGFRELGFEDQKSALIDCTLTKRYGLFLSIPHVFMEPLYCKGEMGIWYYDLGNQVKVKKQSNKQYSIL